LWTDKRTDVRMDGRLRPSLLGRLRGVDLKTESGQNPHFERLAQICSADVANNWKSCTTSHLEDSDPLYHG